ncbi:MAG TPA: peptidylprolyl isomerase [Patescibacteria group bacterium]|nr:peptidylprolyl isomerase [Patescibacteria group bacterium]
MKKGVLLVLLLCFLAIVGVGVFMSKSPNKNEVKGGVMAAKATIQTSKGSFTIELYPDETPQTVKNFSDKALSGYYKNLTFHRVESWVTQGGDPQGNGTGGGKMPTELSKRTFGVGSVGVARGPDIAVSNDSQFFVCTDDCAWLTGQYTNFGKVVDGMDVVKSIQVGDTIQNISIQP